MKYNPYNWGITKAKTPIPRPTLIHNCVLDELGYVCTELDLVKLEEKKLQMDIIENEKKKLRLQKRKEYLLEKLYE